MTFKITLKRCSEVVCTLLLHAVPMITAMDQLTPANGHTNADRVSLL